MPDWPGIGSAATRRARSSLRAALELLLPAACAVCERLLDASDSGIACARCWTRARALPHPRCERCGHPLSGACRWCDSLPPFVRAVRSAYWIPGGTAGAIVHALKYGGWPAVAVEMGERMARLAWPSDVVRERTALVPVPLARIRERERGYNQSTHLARALAQSWTLPVWSSCIERARDTTSQTRLTPLDRRRNVSGAFRLTATCPRGLRGAHVVLVDDVVTTGATLSECAAILFAGGARVISIVTFGRATAPGDPIQL